MGVVDDNGMLIGNISARDLKQIKPNNIFGLLTKSCGAFVSYIKQQSIEETAPVISCTLETSFEYLLKRMAFNKIHRLYVCDKELKATHIISLRDIISCIVSAKEE
jgi:CBS-domain-containing membrane protein